MSQDSEVTPIEFHDKEYLDLLNKLEESMSATIIPLTNKQPVSEVNHLFCDQCGAILTSRGCLMCAVIDHNTTVVDSLGKDTEETYDTIKALVNDHSLSDEQIVDRLRNILNAW